MTESEKYKLRFSDKSKVIPSYTVYRGVMSERYDGMKKRIPPKPKRLVNGTRILPFLSGGGRGKKEPKIPWQWLKVSDGSLPLSVCGASVSPLF